MFIDLLPYNLRIKFYDDESQILPPLNPKSNYPKLYYVNGMGTSLEKCVQDARELIKTFGAHANVIPAYSKTFGPAKDLITVWIGRHIPSHDSIFAKIFRDRLIEDIQQLEQTSDPRKIFIVPFSRGGIDVYHAARNLSLKQKSRLVIISCGSAMILPKSLGCLVDNLISKGDLACLYLHQELNLDQKAYQPFANVILLERKDGFKGLQQDHFFTSQTYQGALRQYRSIYTGAS